MEKCDSLFKRFLRFLSNIFFNRKLLEESPSNDKNDATISDEIEVLNLQKDYINGKINENALSKDQILKLEKLFINQIESCYKQIEQNNKKTLSKLFSNPDTYELFNSFQRGDISEEQLTKEQIVDLELIYKIQIEIENDKYKLLSLQNN